MKTASRRLLACVMAGWIGCLSLGAAELEPGFKSLFNGADLTGWEGDPQHWSVKEGVITGQTTTENPVKYNTFLIWKDGKVGDFELRLAYRIVGNGPKGSANSGIQYRSKPVEESKGKYRIIGYQGDFEAGDMFSGILYEEGGRGILAQRGQMTVVDASGKPKAIASLGKTEDIQAGIRKGEWNDYVIIAKGNRLTHIINGRVTADVTDNDEARRAMTGLLALQLHAGEPMTVQFKNIRIQELK